MEGLAIMGSEQKPDAVIINVNQTAEVQSDPTKLAKEIVEMLKDVKPLPTPEEERPECCIYRVPDILRSLDKKAYTPQVISIGPYHRGSKTLKVMEEHKLGLFKRFWEQHGEKLGELLEIIRKNEEKIRSFYAEKVELDSDAFVKMVLVDAIFIIEYMRTSKGEDYNQSVSNSYIYWDLVLLENQLPLFIIQDLCNHVFSLKEDFTSLVLEFFQSINKQVTASKSTESIKQKRTSHFVDLVKYLHLPQKRSQCESGGKSKVTTSRHLAGVSQVHDSGEKPKASACQHLPSASQLHESGLKFKASTGGVLNFTKGVLEIPCLKIEDHTQSLFRNIMAFEQCYSLGEAGFVDYIALLDSLINTTADVDLLVKNGILFHKLGDSKAVIDFVNKLCTNIVRSEIKDTYSDLRKELCAYYKKRRHLWKAVLKHDYFSTPWRVASTIAAITLLALTAIQTVCSILQVV